MGNMHFIRDQNVGPTKIITACGLVAFHQGTSLLDCWLSEAKNLILASKRTEKTTCVKCLGSRAWTRRATDKISATQEQRA